MAGTDAEVPRHLRTDLHLHSTFSDGRSDVPTLVGIARSKGFEIAISDHCSTYFGMVGSDVLERYVSTLERHPVYRSIELDLGQEYPLPPEVLARLDYCIGSMHMVVDDEGNRVRPERYSTQSMQHYMDCVVRQFERGVRSGRVAMVGHPTFLPDLPRQGQDELWTADLQERIVNVAAETGVALEISTRYTVPTESMMRQALAAGARFAVASDGHRPDALGAVEYARRLAVDLAIPDDRFFLPARRLVEYS